MIAPPESVNVQNFPILNLIKRLINKQLLSAMYITLARLKLFIANLTLEFSQNEIIFRHSSNQQILH